MQFPLLRISHFACGFENSATKKRFSILIQMSYFYVTLFCAPHSRYRQSVCDKSGVWSLSVTWYRSVGEWMDQVMELPKNSPEQATATASERTNPNDGTTTSETACMDKFKASFKKFKYTTASKSKANADPCPNLEKVFDSDLLPEVSGRFQYRVISPLRVPTCEAQKQDVQNVRQVRLSSNLCQQPFPGLVPFSEWTVIKFDFPAGLIFVRNPFTPAGQRYWISKCVHDYPHTRAHVTNVSNLAATRNQHSNGGGAYNSGTETDTDLFKKLRWVTFGYHHNWDTKVYTEESKCKFPDDLAELTKYLSLVLGFRDFKAEAAIVNYYNMDSTLSGHQDRSEDYQEAPLFSISFGQSAVFLIGGDRKEIEPLSIFLRSGDIVVMSEKSRKSYHAVPRVVSCKADGLWPWLFKEDSKINSINTDIAHDLERDEEPSAKRIKQSSELKSNKLEGKCGDCLLCSFLKANDLTLNNKSQFSLAVDKWEVDNFLNAYISQHRVNLNVRQVLFPDQSKLRNTVDEKN